MSHGRLYQQRMKNAFDKKVRLRKFHEGDLVLKKMSHAVKDNRGKWAPNYEGPFVVKRAFSRGALVLTNMESAPVSLALAGPRRACCDTLSPPRPFIEKMGEEVAAQLGRASWLLHVEAS